MPPKKKEIKEPDVTVPAGDPKRGKALFDEQCSACHAIEVSDAVIARETISRLLPPCSEELWEGRLAPPVSLLARL
jgi:cytochrome c